MGDLLDRARLGERLGGPDMLHLAPVVQPHRDRAGRLAAPRLVAADDGEPVLQQAEQGVGRKDMVAVEPEQIARLPLDRVLQQLGAALRQVRGGDREDLDLEPLAGRQGRDRTVRDQPREADRELALRVAVAGDADRDLHGRLMHCSA